MRFILLLFPILLILCSGVHGEDTFHEKYQFGKDQIIIYTNIYEKEVVNTNTIRILQRSHNLDLREGITLLVKKPYNYTYVVGENERYYYINYSNIGKYIEEIQSESQVSNLLSFLHRDLYNFRFDTTGFSNIVNAAKIKTNNWPFVIINENIEPDTIKKIVFKRDKVWLAHFLIAEKTSVYEYKYVIMPGNKIHRLRRKLIEGPEMPVDKIRYARMSDWSSETREKFVDSNRCSAFLLSQTAKNRTRMSPIDSRLELELKKLLEMNKE